jgi:predicted RNase H-like nuclease (RuvC/YqgF family)
MTKTNIKTGSTETHMKITAQQAKRDFARLQREIKELKQKLEKNEWRRKELESFLKMLIKASNAESLKRAGLFKRSTGDCKKQALETCGRDS